MILKDRLVREKHTIELMIRIFCKGHNTDHDLCNECNSLLQQVHKRIEHCRYGLHKPNCSRCSLYCYSADMRNRIKAVMKYSGPRMLIYHPILVILHLKDAKNKLL